MAELLVNYDSLDELCVLQLASHLALHLDKLKVNILPLHVSHSEDGIHSNLCHLSVAPVDTERQQRHYKIKYLKRSFNPTILCLEDSHFGSQRCHGGLNEWFCVVGITGEGFCNFVQLLDGNACSLVITVRDPDGVDPTIQQLLCLLKQSPSQH